MVLSEIEKELYEKICELSEEMSSLQKAGKDTTEICKQLEAIFDRYFIFKSKKGG